MRRLDYASLFRNFRKFQGLTQIQLGERFETDQSRISKIERGILRPDADEILHLLNLLGLDQVVRMEELLKDAPTKEVEHESLQRSS